MAAFAVPLTRRRSGIDLKLSLAALALGPPSIRLLLGPSKLRDGATYALGMWAFTIAHELPFDDPERLEQRLRVRYPIAIDRCFGFGRLPNARLQRLLRRGEEPTRLDWVLTWTHWLWFLEPHSALLYVMARRPEEFGRGALRMQMVYDIGCLGYFGLPTAPPWWAAENGHTDGEQVRRIMVEVGERQWGDAWPRLYEALGGNPWAAMPSLHFAASLMAAIVLAETDPVAGAVGTAYAATLGFALVYLGEHYLTDLLAGAAVVVVVRRVGSAAAPLAEAVSARLRRPEFDPSFLPSAPSS